MSEDTEEVIIINGKIINNLRYADDTVLIAGSIENLQKILNKVVTAIVNLGLNLNARKTKYMVIDKEQNPTNMIRLKNVPLDKVQKITYLGQSLIDNCYYCHEIRCCIEKARAVFVKMKNIFCSHQLSMNLRIRMICCYIFTVFFYGAETWTLSKVSINRIEAFEMWIYRRVLKISYCAHITNINVLKRINKELEI